LNGETRSLFSVEKLQSVAVMPNSLPFLSQQDEGGCNYKGMFLPTSKEKGYVERVGWMLQFFAALGD